MPPPIVYTEPEGPPLVARSVGAHAQTGGYSTGITMALIGEPWQQALGVILVLASMGLTGWTLWVRAKYGTPGGDS